MRFSPSVVDKVLCTDVGEMTHCILPTLIVEYWTCVHYLNSTLVNLVEVMAMDYRARHWLPNPIAAP